jgi:Acetyltransferases
MKIRLASPGDVDGINASDKHIGRKELQSIINQNRVYVAQENGQFLGWLRYNLFWDNTPFVNMLFVLEPYRGKGIGKALMLHWEEDMKSRRYDLLMTSTMSSETPQHFYRKLGYRDAGSLLLPNEPLEIIFIKEI